MNKKYEFTGEIVRIYGHTLRRIRAISDIKYKGVCAGDLGGLIESEDNLSHEGSSWIFGGAKVYGNAKVFDNACVCGTAEVYDNAYVYSNASVHGHARVYGCSRVFGDAHVYDWARVHDYANVLGRAKICGDSEVCGSVAVRGEAILCDGHSYSHDSHICVGPVGSHDEFVTLNLTSGTVCTWDFKGTIDEFAAKVKATHVDTEYAKHYADLIGYFRATMLHNQPSLARG